MDMGRTAIAGIDKEFRGLVFIGKAAPPEEAEIADFEQLQVAFDPLRHKILGLLADEPSSIREMGQNLQVNPSRLYHHVGLLEEKGYLRQVDTRTSGKNIERIYGLTATRFRFAPGLGEFPRVDMSSHAAAQMQEWVQEIGQAMRDKDEGLFGEPEKDYTGIRMRFKAPLSLSRATEFRKRLDELVAEYFKSDEEGLGYTFLAVLMPTEPK